MMLHFFGLLAIIFCGSDLVFSNLTTRGDYNIIEMTGQGLLPSFNEGFPYRAGAVLTISIQISFYEFSLTFEFDFNLQSPRNV